MQGHREEASKPNCKINDFPSEEGKVPEVWTRHEHVADPVSQEAQHLVNLAGSAELAKQAIDEIEKPRPTAAKEELAHDLGYRSVQEMMEQTEIVPLPTGSFIHLTTDADGYWVAWTDKPYYDIQRFDSRLHALSVLQENADWISLQS